MCQSATKKQNAQHLHDKLEAFVNELLLELDEQLDKRLVRTFLLTLQAIIKFRHSQYGLLLSELGGYILTPPAWTLVARHVPGTGAISAPDPGTSTSRYQTIE